MSCKKISGKSSKGFGQLLRNRKKKFYITTLGCKVNQYESDGIAAELTGGGWTRCKNSEKSQLCIINTCAVTSRAAMQSRQEIRSIIRSNPHAKIIVTGCHAQTAPDEINKIEHVDIITGHKDKFNIARAVMADDNNKKIQNDFLPFPENPSCSDKTFHSFSPSVTGSKTRAYLKIQDGCNAFCTYCIVPHARGRSRSMPEKEVLNHLYHLASAGYKEAIITGIHAGAYGLDFKEKSTLTLLLGKIELLRPIYRIRLSSIEPGEFTDEIIALAAKKTWASEKIQFIEKTPASEKTQTSDKIQASEKTRTAEKIQVVKKAILCDHFHIPLQSGDDHILKRMKRPYNSALFESLVIKIHNAVPSAAIGVDILLGFPGESDDAFENTFNLVEKLPVTYLHVFPFSPRRGTPAFDFPDKVDSKTVKTRCAVMRELGVKKTRDFENRQMGKVLESIIQEKRDKKTGKLIAVTSNYLSVLVDGEDEFKRQIVNIKVEVRKEDNSLYGIIVQNNYTK